MNISFGPVQHMEEGDRYDIIAGGVEIGVAYPKTGYAYINEDALRDSVGKALREHFGTDIELLEVY